MHVLRRHGTCMQQLGLLVSCFPNACATDRQAACSHEPLALNMQHETLRVCAAIPCWLHCADFNYNQTIPKYMLRLPGRVHQGFASIAASIWPPLRSALSQLMPSRDNGNWHPGSGWGSPRGISNVYVSGHSLGAGVATLIAYTMQVRFQSGPHTGHIFNLVKG